MKKENIYLSTIASHAVRTAKEYGVNLKKRLLTCSRCIIRFYLAFPFVFNPGTIKRRTGGRLPAVDWKYLQLAK